MRPTASSSRFAPALAVLVWVVAGAWSLVTLPAPRDVAPRSGFDTERALEHLRFVARDPRPLGSAHHRRVREYLVSQFRSMGLDAQEQEARVPLRRDGTGPRIEVSNVVARLPGAGGASTTHAVMLAAHYDSTHTNAAASRGAGDDGAAVAALLEVARVLTSDRPQNDVIFLITDGEERGLLGARAFVDEHPWFAHAGVVFNFEARGTSGPSIMFQTSPGNAWLVEQYARVAPHPVASSIGYEIYRLMPNNTDFTVFRDAGLRGLNFAFIGDYHNYHRAGDTFENLDVRSLRHHGVQALALARHFGTMQLTPIGVYDDAIYFNVASLGIVRYPQRWALPIAVAAAAACMVAVVWVVRRHKLGASAILWGITVLLLNLAVAALIAWAVLMLVPTPALDGRPNASIAGFALLAALCTLLVPRLFRRRTSVLVLATVSLIVWSALAVAGAVFVPAASYLFAWPALFGAVAMIALTLRDSLSTKLVAAACALPLVLLLTPVAYLAFVGLRVRLAPAVVVVIVLALWGLVPHLAALTARSGPKEKLA